MKFALFVIALATLLTLGGCANNTSHYTHYRLTDNCFETTVNAQYSWSKADIGGIGVTGAKALLLYKVDPTEETLEELGKVCGEHHELSFIQAASFVHHNHSL